MLYANPCNLHMMDFPVVKCTDKHFTADINGRKDTVSVDRFKPAHLEFVDDTHPTSQAGSEITSALCQVTRSGRRVHWPKYLSSYVS